MRPKRRPFDAFQYGKLREGRFSGFCEKCGGPTFYVRDEDGSLRPSCIRESLQPRDLVPGEPPS